jgi:hypothetical protein
MPNGRKIFQMVINMTTFSSPRSSKFCPNWDFWFENKPSGNPEAQPTPLGCTLLVAIISVG